MGRLKSHYGNGIAQLSFRGWFRFINGYETPITHILFLNQRRIFLIVILTETQCLDLH